jgi:hypothetical protein
VKYMLLIYGDEEAFSSVGAGTTLAFTWSATP